MSFRDRLKNVTKSISILSKHSPEEAALLEERLNTCEGCPELRKPFDQCAACGCFVKAKARLKGASCPLGKW